MNNNSLRQLLVPGLVLALGLSASVARAGDDDSGSSSRAKTIARADEQVLTLVNHYGRTVRFEVELETFDRSLVLRDASGRDASRLTLDGVRDRQRVEVRVAEARADRRDAQIAGNLRVVVRDARTGRTLDRFGQAVQFERGTSGDDPWDRNGRDDDRGGWGRDDDRDRDDRGGWGRDDDRDRDDRGSRGQDWRDRDWARSRPSGYETLSGTRVTRLADSEDPLRVYWSDARYRRVVGRAVGVWNDAAERAGLTETFVLATSRSSADVVLDFSGRGRRDGRACATSYDRRGRSWELVRVAFDDDLDPRDPASVAVVAHELGHVLGLGHSPDQGDLMSANARWRASQSWVRASDRDVRMVGWLYRQRPDVLLRAGHDGWPGPGGGYRREMADSSVTRQDWPFSERRP